jgi:phytoene/squalene synthetase
LAAVERSALGRAASSGLGRAITESGLTSTHWRKLGAAVREIELVANLGTEAHIGRLRLPLDELERAGVDPKDLPRTPWPASVTALLRDRHAALRAAVANEVALVKPGTQAGARGLLVWAALAWRMSLRAERALPAMIVPSRYHALADGWHAWRAARRATVGKLRLG